jgi:hypothetical protein
MPAYYRDVVSELLVSDSAALLGRLEAAYASDGFATQFTPQTRAWADLIPLLANEPGHSRQCSPAAWIGACSSSFLCTAFRGESTLSC